MKYKQLLCCREEYFLALDESFLGYGIYTLDKFEFENGCVLSDVNVEYYIIGTPKYDDEGTIVNAVVYCHNYNGSCFSLNNLYQITAEGAPFDKNEYLIICITSMGFPESCSPSSTGLKLDFPEFSILDGVNFKKQFLKEFLNIEKVLGIAGRGFGGYVVYTWACEYPDDMEFIIVCDSSFRSSGYRYAISKAIENIIVSSEGFYSDNYDVSLSNTMVSINRLIYSNYFSKSLLQEMSNDEIDVLMDDFVEEGLFKDIYDIKYKNDVLLNFDLTDKLSNIKAKALILGNTNEIFYFYKHDALPVKDLIDDSEVVLYESLRNPHGYEDHSVIIDDLERFLNDFKNKKSKS